MNNLLSKAAQRFMTLDADDQSWLSLILFFVPFGVWFFSRTLLFQTTFAGYLQFVNYSDIRFLCFGAIVFREILFGRWDRLSFLGLLITVFMAWLANGSGSAWVLDSICFVFAARNIDFNRIAKFGFILLVVLVLFVMISAAIGLIPNGTAMRAGTQTRYHMGFSHPNTGPAFLFFALCLWVFIRGSKISIADVVVSIAIIALVYYLTRSRTSCGLAAALVLFSFVFRFFPDGLYSRRGFKWLAIGSVVLCAVVGIIIPALYDPSVGWMKALNSAMSGRLALGHKAIQKCGVPLLAQVVDLSNSKRFDLLAGQWVQGNGSGLVVDIAYLNRLLSSGIVFVVIAVVLATLSNIRAYREHRWYLLIAVAFVAFHGLSENCCMYISYNFFLFLMGELFYIAKREGNTS